MIPCEIGEAPYEDVLPFPPCLWCGEAPALGGDILCETCLLDPFLGIPDEEQEDFENYHGASEFSGLSIVGVEWFDPLPEIDLYAAPESAGLYEPFPEDDGA